MRIALITPWMVRCGIYSYSRDLAEAIANLGHEVFIIRLPRFGTKTAEILQNVVDSIPIDKIDIIVVSHEYGFYQGLEGGFYSGLKDLGKPICTILHAVGSYAVDDVVASTSDIVIVHNEFCARRFGHPSVIIPHGCSPAKALPIEEAKRSYGFKPDWRIVGYLGFISDYKGLETLIEAMTKIPDAGLLIGGGWHTDAETTYIQTLKQRSLELLSSRCQWLGYVTDEDLPRAYGAMDIVVYPSRFSTESGALLMALSHGKAVLASNLSPFKEKEKRGALQTFRDIPDLRRKIRRLLRDEEMRTGLEHGAWDYAQNNRWENVASRHISLYESILKKEELAFITKFKKSSIPSL